SVYTTSFFSCIRHTPTSTLFPYTTLFRSDQARRFLGLERRVEDATARAWHVYYVQNGQSTDLEALLQRAFTPGHVSPTPPPPGATAPGAEPLRMTGGFGGRAGGTSSTGGQSSTTSTTQGTGAAAGATPTTAAA